MADPIPGLAVAIPDDLTERDALWLMLTVEGGYAYPTPTMELLRDLGYLWMPKGGHVLYPTLAGRDVAIEVALVLLANAKESGNADDVARAEVCLTLVRRALLAPV